MVHYILAFFNIGHVNQSLGIVKELVLKGNDVIYYTNKDAYDIVKKNTGAEVKVLW